jgi:hypothetical protein
LVLRDGEGGKPWVDGSDFAARDFWNGEFPPIYPSFAKILMILTAKDTWLPTWGEGNDRGMTVKSVKMWEHGNC